MQRIAEKLGHRGCYFLSLVRAGEILTGTNQDALRLYQNEFSKKYKNYRGKK